MPTCSLQYINISPASPVRMKTNAAVQLMAVGYDIGNNPQHGTTFTWTSSDTNVATVSAAGVVTLQNKEGQCVITATSGSITGQVTVQGYK